MNQKLLTMTDKELRKYLSTHRQDEEAFSEALEILISRKENPFVYPPVSQMNEADINNISQELKNKINS